MLHRRKLIGTLGAVALSMPLGAIAQTAPGAQRIGVFILGNADAAALWLAAFRQGMTDLRWAEGRDYVIDARYAGGDASAAPALAAALVNSRPALLLTSGDAGTRALAQHAREIPIVFTIAQDPVGNGFAASLRQPGGATTGLTSLASDLGGKRLQLLKEAAPSIKHAGLLFEPDHAGSTLQAKEIEGAARQLGLRVTALALHQAADIGPAFKTGAARGARAYIVAEGSITNTQRQTIATHILHLKAPSIGGNIEYVEAGGLMSYAASFQDNFRRAAAYAVKILKGAKPGDLPIEQPMRFDLALNRSTARVLGLKFPHTILLLATREIE